MYYISVSWSYWLKNLLISTFSILALYSFSSLLIQTILDNCKTLSEPKVCFQTSSKTSTNSLPEVTSDPVKTIEDFLVSLSSIFLISSLTASLRTFDSVGLHDHESFLIGDKITEMYIFFMLKNRDYCGELLLKNYMFELFIPISVNWHISASKRAKDSYRDPFQIVSGNITLYY